MLRKPWDCGWPIWNRSMRRLQDQCWLRNKLDMKICFMYLRTRGWEVMVGSKSFFEHESSWSRGDMRLTSMTRYNIKEIWWHGEVASVNLEAVKQERGWGLPRSLRSICWETAWMWMKWDCSECEFTGISADNLVSQPLPVPLQIEDCPPNRCQGRSQTASISLLHSFVIRMVLRSGPFFTLASWSNHGALGEDSQLNMAFTTATRPLG